MKKGIITICTLLICIGGFKTTSAIPAFARKYRMSCMTCHNPIPRLKPYGNTFAAAGFRLPDHKTPRYYEKTGDPLLSLIREFPLAVRMDAFISYDDFEGDNDDGSDYKTPFVMKMMSGGTLSDHLSYYFYFLFYERGEVGGVEDAYLMYNDLFNIDLDIFLGQFQASDPLFKRELRLTLEDYHIYTYTPGLSNINLEYEKGLMVSYGTNFGTTIVGELVNGNGIGEANERWRFDKDKYKDVMGRVSQDIGENFRVGAFVYSGKEKILVNTELPDVNTVFMWGPDLTIDFGQILQLNAQYLQRNDSRVFEEMDNGNRMWEDVNANGGFGELIFTPKGDQSRWYLVGMYNWTDSDIDAYDYESATFHAGYLLRRNVRLVSEFTYRFKTDANEKFWRTSLGFVAAF